ncbi:MAG: hypothetical protein ACD_12C00806G0006 [uncultured bacterium]|nr:MAG: hypothetical protein ACD_12C00806G0006 [uncultured bacterium]
MEEEVRKGGEECNNLCGPMKKLACYLLALARGQNNYGAFVFPEGQNQLNRILMKFAALARDPNHCRSISAGNEIEAMTKEE